MATQVQFCPFCGKQVLAADATFCAYCGRSFPDGSAQAQAQQVGLGVAPSTPALPSNALYASMQVSQPGQFIAPAGYPVPLVGPGAYYAGMATSPASSPVTSVGRVLGIMFGMIGLLLFLSLVRIFLPALIGLRYGLPIIVYFNLSSFFASIVGLLPLSYWLALARLRFVGAGRALLETVVACFIFTFVIDVLEMLLYPILMPGFRFASLTDLLGRLLPGEILPIPVGAALGFGAALLLARWSVARQHSSEGVALRDLALICGSILGGYLVFDVIYLIILRTIVLSPAGSFGYIRTLGALSLFDLMLSFLLEVGFVVLASLLTLAALRRARPQPFQPFAYTQGVAPSPAASPSQTPQTPAE